MTLHRGSVLLGLALLAAASTARAQDDERVRARTEFNRGVERFEAEDYQGALDAFQEAYRLAPHPTVRVNMANCYEQLNRPLEAIFHYERFLAELPDAPELQRREVHAALARLRRRVAAVSLRVSPDGATVIIDGRETRRSPIAAPITMMAGSHSLEASMEGYETDRRELVVEGGHPIEVRVVLRPEAASAPPVAVPAAGPGPEGGSGAVAAEPPVEQGSARGGLESAEGLSDARSPGELATPDGEPGAPGEVQPPASSAGLQLSTPVVIAGAATAVLLVGAVVTGVLALGADSDFDDAVLRSNDGTLSGAERDAARRDGLDASDRAHTLAHVTDVLLVGTLLGAGAAAYFFLTQRGESTERPHARLRLTATPVATRTGGGLLVQGAF